MKNFLCHERSFFLIMLYTYSEGRETQFCFPICKNLLNREQLSFLPIICSKEFSNEEQDSFVSICSNRLINRDLINRKQLSFLFYYTCRTNSTQF